MSQWGKIEYVRASILSYSSGQGYMTRVLKVMAECSIRTIPQLSGSGRGMASPE